MTRREMLFASAVAAFAESPSPSRLSVEAYIFQQYAQRSHKQLGDVLSDVLSMARIAGFRNIELNSGFFTPELRSRTLELIGTQQLKTPSVYCGGIMHDPRKIDATIARALSICEICKPSGCTALVFNADPKGEKIEKTGDKLAIQAKGLDHLGAVLSKNGFDLRVHNHTPEMLNNAREWRNTLRNTDPKFVSHCLDLDWVYQGEQDPLALLKEAGARVHEIHVRSSRNKLWVEDLEPGDIDYGKIANYLESAGQKPLVVVELAYRDNTIVTRSLEQNLLTSRIFAEQIFQIYA